MTREPDRQARHKTVSAFTVQSKIGQEWPVKRRVSVILDVSLSLLGGLVFG